MSRRLPQQELPRQGRGARCAGPHASCGVRAPGEVGPRARCGVRAKRTGPAQRGCRVSQVPADEDRHVQGHADGALRGNAGQSIAMRTEARQRACQEGLARGRTANATTVGARRDVETRTSRRLNRASILMMKPEEVMDHINSLTGSCLLCGQQPVKLPTRRRRAGTGKVGTHSMPNTSRTVHCGPAKKTFPEPPRGKPEI